MLPEILQKVDERPSMAIYREAARQVLSLRETLDTVRVSLLASFTIDPLLPFLAVEAAREGFAADVSVGPFNSVIQELVNPDSACVGFRPDLVFVARLLDDVSPLLSQAFASLGPEEISGEVGRIVSELMAGLTTFRTRSTAAIIVHSFVPSLFGRRPIGDGIARGAQAEVVRQLNIEMSEAVRALPDVHVLDYEALIAESGRRDWHDKKMWYLGRAPLSATALPALARQYARYLRALRRPGRKCLVVDLDDTLWGGVLGEVGLTGVKLGADYPGNVFKDFQRAILQLKHRGVLLAINSKNNLDEAQEVFVTHPQMILRLEDFAAVRINWESKPTNMLAIARELNIGLDSLVFVDDSPTERALMQQALPEILTLELPPNPVQYADVLAESGAFERLAVTREDRLRTEMYRAQRERRELEHTALSLEDFLKSLKMQVTIEAVAQSTLDRVGELVQKTNQFNLTTRRYTVAQIATLMADPEHGVFCVRVVDRFGDNGIVGVAIVKETQGLACIDTLLLSCRVIGRTIETALLAFIEQWAKGRGLQGIEGEYVPTARNAPAADFFPRHQFEEAGREAGVVRWRLPMEHADLQWPAYMAVSA